MCFAERAWVGASSGNRQGDTDAGSADVDCDQADEQCQRGDDFKIDQSFHAHSSDLPKIRVACNTDHKSRKQQRRDDGLDQVEEDETQ